jgi:hypothetical protein
MHQETGDCFARNNIITFLEAYMTKIAFIGAGSLGFTRELVRDILTFPLLADSEIALMDINPERLDFSRRSVEKSSAGELSRAVTATLDESKRFVCRCGIDHDSRWRLSLASRY